MAGAERPVYKAGGFPCSSVLFFTTTPPGKPNRKTVARDFRNIFGEGGNLIKYIIKCNMILHCKHLKNSGIRLHIFFFLK